MKNLLWFRAFNRASIGEIVQLLHNGDTPHPDPDTGTRRNEEALGISPPCVYVYLGQTLEEFGKSAIALGCSDFSGNVSPFDTGGLVDHIQPVCHWPSDEKKLFLSEYTWPSSDLASLFTHFPGEEHEQVLNYLNGIRPNGAGLHDHIGGLPEAALWKENKHWRAWIWEGRCPKCLPIGHSLQGWTCPPELYAQFSAEALHNPDQRDWFLFLAKKYVRGGVSELIRRMRPKQEAA